MLSRPTNPEMLARHMDHFHVPMYNNRSLSYDYTPSPLSPHAMPNEADWMSRTIHPAVALPTANYEFSGYTYSNSPHNQTIGGLSQHEHVQALYPTAGVMGAYAGPHLSANPRSHSQQVALSPHFNELFQDSQEGGERPGYYACT